MAHLSIVQSLPSTMIFALLRLHDAVQPNSVMGAEPPPWEAERIQLEAKKSELENTVKINAEIILKLADELVYGLADPIVQQLSLQDVKVIGQEVGRVKIDAPP